MSRTGGSAGPAVRTPFWRAKPSPWEPRRAVGTASAMSGKRDVAKRWSDTDADDSDDAELSSATPEAGGARRRSFESSSNMLRRDGQRDDTSRLTSDTTLSRDRKQMKRNSARREREGIIDTSRQEEQIVFTASAAIERGDQLEGSEDQPMEGATLPHYSGMQVEQQAWAESVIVAVSKFDVMRTDQNGMKQHSSSLETDLDSEVKRRASMSSLGRQDQRAAEIKPYVSSWIHSSPSDDLSAFGIVRATAWDHNHSPFASRRRFSATSFDDFSLATRTSHSTGGETLVMNNTTGRSTRHWAAFEGGKDDGDSRLSFSDYCMVSTNTPPQRADTSVEENDSAKDSSRRINSIERGNYPAVSLTKRRNEKYEASCEDRKIRANSLRPDVTCNSADDRGAKHDADNGLDSDDNYEENQHLTESFLQFYPLNTDCYRRVTRPLCRTDDIIPSDPNADDGEFKKFIQDLLPETSDASPTSIMFRKARNATNAHLKQQQISVAEKGHRDSNERRSGPKPNESEHGSSDQTPFSFAKDTAQRISVHSERVNTASLKVLQMMKGGRKKQGDAMAERLVAGHESGSDAFKGRRSSIDAFGAIIADAHGADTGQVPKQSKAVARTDGSREYKVNGATSRAVSRPRGRPRCASITLEAQKKQLRRGARSLSPAR